MSAACEYDPAVTVKARTNTLVGQRLENGVLVFKGVPFAKPPVGKLRWKPAEELPESDELLVADTFAPGPVQTPLDQPGRPKVSDLPYDEDCLYLNIWAADTVTPNKPVMVWLYGGAFVRGTAADPRFYGDKLIEENPDIILVTANYRVGFLGALDLSTLDKTGEYKYSNNLSVLDARSALKWVNENIGAFGGDKDNVTVFGQSAGSNNTTANLRSAESRKYFKKIIGQSSFSADIGVTDLATARLIGAKLIERLGCTTMEQMLTVPPQRLLDEADKVYADLRETIELKLFSPVEDGIVLCADDHEKLAAGAAADKIALLGMNQGEYDNMLTGASEETAIKRTVGDKRMSYTGRPVPLEQYIANYPERGVVEACQDYRNDLFQRLPANLFAEELSYHGDAYLYYFVWRDPKEETRTRHGSEIPLVFGHPAEHVPQAMAKSIRQAWVNFARTGKPSAEGLPEWPKYSREERATMVLDEQSHVEQGVRMKDFQLLYPMLKEYKNLKK